MIRTATYPPLHPRPATEGYRYFFNGQDNDGDYWEDGLPRSGCC